MANDFLKARTLRHMKFQAVVWSYSGTRQHPLTVYIATSYWVSQSPTNDGFKDQHCPLPYPWLKMEASSCVWFPLAYLRWALERKKIIEWNITSWNIISSLQISLTTTGAFHSARLQQVPSQCPVWFTCSWRTSCKLLLGGCEPLHVLKIMKEYMCYFSLSK